MIDPQVVQGGASSWFCIAANGVPEGTMASIQQTSSTGLRIGDRVRVRDNGIELLPNS